MNEVWILFFLIIILVLLLNMYHPRVYPKLSYPYSYSSSFDDDAGTYIQKRLETCEKCCHTYEPLPECKDFHENRLVKCGRESEQCRREQSCLTKCLQERKSSTKEDLDFCRHIICG